MFRLSSGDLEHAVEQESRRQSAAALEFVTALLATLTDPKATSENLAKIKAEADKVSAERKKLNQVKKEQAAQQEKLDQYRVDLEQREEKLRTIDAATADANAQIARATELTRDLDRTKADHDLRKTAIDEAEAHLKSQQEVFNSRLAGLLERERKLAENEGDLRQRVTELKRIAVR